MPSQAAPGLALPRPAMPCPATTCLALPRRKLIQNPDRFFPQPIDAPAPGWGSAGLSTGTMPSLVRCRLHPAHETRNAGIQRIFLDGFSQALPNPEVSVTSGGSYRSGSWTSGGIISSTLKLTIAIRFRQFMTVSGFIFRSAFACKY